jgi:trimeric autotransporter adhesin
MKTKLLFALCLISAGTFSQNVGIGTTTPDASALLEINASNKGILVPRLNLLSPTDIVTVPSPATGLLVISLNNNTAQMPDGAGFYVWTGRWTKLLLNENSNTTNGWTTRGNSGTHPDSNFVGTKDARSLVFKISNGLAGKIDTSGSLSFGRGTLLNNPVPNINTAFGDSALFNNGIGGFIFPLASENTAVGVKALYSNTNGRRNTAMGDNALFANVFGAGNSAYGYKALLGNTQGNGNTAIGSAALSSNTTGGNNTAIGSSALGLNNGIGNTAVGSLALFLNRTGSGNASFGEQALAGNTTGSFNTALGKESLYNDSTGYSNVAVGIRALYSAEAGSNMVAVGDSALYKQNNGSAQNTAIGSKGLFNLVSGIQNMAAGFQAGFSTNNSFGTYLGFQAGRNTNGVSNTYIGWGAGTDASVVTIATGGDNVCIGVRSGQGITNGSQNITIGNSINTGSLALNNTVTIGHNISNTQSNSVVLGNAAITKWGFGANVAAANILEFNNAVTTARLTVGGVWTNASDKCIKTNFSVLDGKLVLDKIMQLPVTRWSYLKESGNISHIGPMAQDFYRLFGTGGDDKTISTIDPVGVALVGIQQLKNEINELKRVIADLQQDLKRKR